MIEKQAEQFTLILKHELILTGGERIELNRPIITKWSSMYHEGPPGPVVINHILDTLREYTLEQYFGESRLSHIERKKE